MENKKGKFVKILLKGILFAGAVIIEGNSPYFFTRSLPRIIKFSKYQLKKKELEKKRFYNAFSYLRRRGLVRMEYTGKQLEISLTEEGKKYVGKYQIDDLEIKKPKKWDKIWRILIFDIGEKNKIKREALRGKIKQLGLFQLQKSVWVCPYNFRKEMYILRNFFGLKNREMKVIIASEIEDEEEIKLFFNIK